MLCTDFHSNPIPIENQRLMNFSERDACCLDEMTLQVSPSVWLAKPLMLTNLGYMLSKSVVIKKKHPPAV